MTLELVHLVIVSMPLLEPNALPMVRVIVDFPLTMAEAERVLPFQLCMLRLY